MFYKCLIHECLFKWQLFYTLNNSLSNNGFIVIIFILHKICQSTLWPLNWLYCISSSSCKCILLTNRKKLPIQLLDYLKLYSELVIQLQKNVQSIVWSTKDLPSCLLYQIQLADKMSFAVDVLCLIYVIMSVLFLFISL